MFFDSSTLPKLSPHQADSCDGLLTKEECYASLKSFCKGKSPGTDGLTAEFYLSFRELLGQELVDSFNYAFEKGEMLISPKRGIITLTPKKDKNRTLLDNWRPISLLNTDYSQSQLELRKCYPAQNYWQQWLLPCVWIEEDRRASVCADVHVHSFWNLFASWWNDNNSRSVSLTNNDKIYGYHGRQKQIILENITDSYDQCGNFDATCFSVLMS